MAKHEVQRNDVRTSPRTAPRRRPPRKRKTWIWIIVAVVVVLAVVSTQGKKEEQPAQSEPISTATPVQVEKLTFTLTEGEKGPYGSEVTFNANTDMPETQIIYHVPAGTYTVNNTSGYPGQLSVNSDETVVNESGWEEPAEVASTLWLDVGGTGTITVQDGQYIELHFNSVELIQQ